MSDAMPEERWLPVVGLEGHYEISSLGRIWSVPRVAVDRIGRQRRIGGRFRAVTHDPLGRQLLRLSVEGRYSNHRVATLVADAFLGPRPTGFVIRHLDDNPDNNSVENLAYGTKSQNNRDSVSNGSHFNISKLTCPLGHLLAEPNLVEWFLRRGERSCLACSRARPAVRKSPRRDFKEVADKRYAAVMANVNVADIRAALEAKLPVPQWQAESRRGIKSRSNEQHRRRGSAA